MSGVRQEHLNDGERVTKARFDGAKYLFRFTMIVLGVFLVGVGVPLWLAGSWYTLRGAIILANIFLSFFGFDLQLPFLLGAQALVACIALGLAYSFVEFVAFPRARWVQSLRRHTHWIVVLFALALWVTLISSDISSTFLGVTNPPEDAWPIAVWVAETPIAAGVWSLFLTVVPESAIISGMLIIWKAPKLQG